MIEIVICDPDTAFAKNLSERIRQEFKQYHINVQITIRADSISLLRNSTPDTQLYFLEIRIPGLSGIQTAKKLRQLNPCAELIFVSNDADAVFDTFCCQPLRFIRKNRIFQELPEAIKAFLLLQQKKQPAALIPASTDEIWLRLSDLIYVESSAHYLNFYCEKIQFHTCGNIDDYWEKLKPFYFVQPSKKYLVSCRYIAKIGEHEILLTNHTLIQMETVQKNAVQTAYFQYRKAYMHD